MTALSTGIASPPMSPEAGPAVVVVDGLGVACASVLLQMTSFIGPSLLAPTPSRVLEGQWSQDRQIGVFRTQDLPHADELLAAHPEAKLFATGQRASSPLGGGIDQPLEPVRICIGHHALGLDAPTIDIERTYTYLVVHGMVRDRETYGAYLRGMRDSQLLITHRCERVVMMGPSNIRRRTSGDFAAGEYFEALGFPSAEHITNFWQSPLYAPLIALRAGAVDVFAGIFDSR
jgi:uncharacterized protein (DUF1330 family)